jgi:hypothetical protein
VISNYDEAQNAPAWFLPAMSDALAPIRNSSATSMEHTITPLRNAARENVPNYFPNTVLDLANLTQHDLVRLLDYYGLNNGGTNPERRTRLGHHLGMRLNFTIFLPVIFESSGLLHKESKDYFETVQNLQK